MGSICATKKQSNESCRTTKTSVTSIEQECVQNVPIRRHRQFLDQQIDIYKYQITKPLKILEKSHPIVKEYEAFLKSTQNEFFIDHKLLDSWTQEIIKVGGKLRLEIATLKLSIDSPPVERFKYAREWIKKLETDVDDLGDDTHDIAKKLKFSN
ncbi:hypothetical protein pb186bvf_015016 [Paramecium bursaria]